MTAAWKTRGKPAELLRKSHVKWFFLQSRGNLGCFLRDFVTPNFDEIHEISLRLPDRAKFGRKCDFAKFRLCTLSDLLSQQLVTTTASTATTIRTTSNEAQARPTKASRLSNAAHSGIRPVARKYLEKILRRRGARYPVATLPSSFCAFYFYAYDPSSPASSHFGYILYMAPFSVWWILANKISPISPHQKKSKRNYVIYLDSRRKKQPKREFRGNGNRNPEL